ncbi:MAG TPA: hypothetical protein VGQ56_02575 [Gemmatimonadaceae bacterium]|jgi:hypothetical protein|nr:hypothetical protein [Gemmatimonadaceae bacterium]
MVLHLKARSAVLLAATAAAIVSPRDSGAQGCEPIRFTSPIDLGGEGKAFQTAHEWELSLGYRRLHSDEFFVGSEANSQAAPGGASPIFNINTFVASVGYSITDRFRVRASVPFSSAKLTRKWADNSIHQQSATGIGDASLSADYWLLEPATHRGSNISVGLGAKAPTGSHTVNSKFYTATGAVDFPADQTIQPGDGGWALVFETQGYRQITERTFAYASGSYMASPKAKSDVQQAPNSGTYWSVPDVYSARLGGAFSVLPEQGLNMSLGGRIDGIPVHDLIGGGDDSTVKRTSYVVFAEPGLSFTHGKGTFTLTVPYRLKVNRMKSELEQRTNGVNGGGFAKYLIFAGYSHRL